MGDGDGKIDAKEDTGAAQSRLQATSVQAASSAQRVVETAAVTVSVEQAPYSISATRLSRSSEYSLKIAPQSGIRPVLVPGMDPSSLPRRESSEAEQAPTAAVPLSGNELPVPAASVVQSPSLTRLSPAPDQEADGLEQPQETAKASAEDQIAALRSQSEQQQLLNASFEERLRKLESAGKAVAVADVIVTLPPDSCEATVDQLIAAAGSNLNATMGGADTAELKQTCELAESMCNVSLFLGRRDVGMGFVVTLWAVLVLLLNILLQTTIAVIVLVYLGDPTFFASMIEDLWYASGPHFASAQHVICCGVACNLP
jgi:hypothetical protein